MPKTKDRVIEAASSAKPYVDRALRDEELREALKRAFAAAQDVYVELIGRRGVTGLASRVATDTEIQDNLRTAAAELRHAAGRLQARESHRRRNATLLLTGIALGILFNPVTGPDARRWLKEKLFGGGGEFGFQDATSGNGAG